MIRRLAFVIFIASLSVANAARLSGVWLPDTQTVNGKRLVLNGIGLRTYSIFHIHIYVAGLYLTRRTDDANAILRSREDKLLRMWFLHDVDAQEARTAWQEGFERNCILPCHLNPDDVRRFLAAVPPVRKGDESTLFFTSWGVEVRIDGRLIGRIDNPRFAEAMLATFIGPAPPSEELKQQLLGDRN